MDPGLKEASVGYREGAMRGQGRVPLGLLQRIGKSRRFREGAALGGSYTLRRRSTSLWNEQGSDSVSESVSCDRAGGVLTVVGGVGPSGRGLAGRAVLLDARVRGDKREDGDGRVVSVRVPGGVEKREG